MDLERRKRKYWLARARDEPGLPVNPEHLAMVQRDPTERAIQARRIVTTRLEPGDAQTIRVECECLQSTEHRAARWHFD